MHGEIEDAPARAIDMIELQPGFVEPYLKNACLKGNLDSASRQNERSLSRHVILPDAVIVLM
jgi:hypothetical protein